MIILITPLGFLSKFYTGPASDWVNNSLGGVFYVIFWILAVFLIRPYWKPILIAVGVLIATSFLECTQLVNHPALSAIRSTFIGRTIIGSTFNPSDFVYYLAGCAIGLAFLTRMHPPPSAGRNSKKAMREGKEAVRDERGAVKKR